jgi:hypothetical protein
MIECEVILNEGSKMNELIAQLNQLKGYSYQIWKFNRGHTELTIRATHKEKEKHNIHLTFANVRYFQFPQGWMGDLYLAPDNELIEILKRADSGATANIPLEILKKMYTLYRADSPGGVIYILGKLIDIKRDVEPIYN